ncbi:tripartite motif-containing protein 2-like [Ylistrum balloti]|uniref:tripartite motif-containing protein 2-like n=1 Tax=Ylistrum balloti TaxID=509963 RepID=UPI00290587D6|nr:tripartite motif-containing protein 2-like [Ylistrum balloti]
MAAGGVVSTTDQYRELQDKLEELTTCPICQERFKQPKILSCHHTFCCPCLQSYFMQTPEDNSPCPLCRCLFFPPKGDVSNLPTSTFMQDVVMMIEKKSPITKKDCMVCKNINKDAGFMCVECDVQMCESCRDIHEMFRMDSHNLLRLDETQDVPIISVIAGKKTSRTCDEHNGQIMEHLCISCNVPICSECKITNHFQHRVQNIIHAAEETRNIIRLLKKSSDPEVKRLRETITDLKSLSTSIQISTDAMKDEVRTTADKLVKTVREKESKMLRIVETDVIARQKELKSIEDATELRLTSIFTFLDYIKSLETFGDVTQLSVAKQTIQKQIDENSVQSTPTLPASCQCNRKFIPSDIFERILHSEDLGKIESFAIQSLRQNAPPIPPRLHRHQNRLNPLKSKSPDDDEPIIPPPRDPKWEVTPSEETSVKQRAESDNEYTNPKEFLWRETDINDNSSPLNSPKRSTPKPPQLNRPLPPPPRPHASSVSLSVNGSQYLKMSSETKQQRLKRVMSDSDLLDETGVKSMISGPKITSGQMSFSAKVRISGLAVTRKDDMIVVSNYSKKCLVFDKFGDLKNEISDQLANPWDAAVSVTDDELKDIVYLTDTGEKSGEGNVKEYKLDGTYLRTLVSKLRKPHGITTSSDGDVIYVCDAEDSSIIALSPRRGKKPRKIKQNMLGKNLFICPWYVSVTAGGEILVSDFHAGKLVGINEDTDRKKKSYKPEKSGNLQDFRPAMSCVDSESNIFVVDQNSNCIFVWAACRNLMKVSIPSTIDIKRPVALAFDSSGALWIGSRKGELVKLHFNL